MLRSSMAARREWSCWRHGKSRSSDYCGCHCVEEEAPGTMMILRDEEVPALFTNKSLRISLAWPTSCRPCASPAISEKADPGRRDPGIAGATHRLTPTVEAMIEPALEQVLAALANQAWKPSHGRRFMTEEIAVSRPPRRRKYRQRLKKLPGVDARSLFSASFNAGVCF